MDKFKVGDKVKVISINPLNSCNNISKIGDEFIINKMEISYFFPQQFWVHGEKGGPILSNDLELVIKTIKDVEVGDVITKISNNACKQKILSLSGEMVALTCYDLKSFNSWHTKDYIEKYYCIQYTSETITIEGKIYNKEEVEKRLSELKPIA